VSRRGRVAAVSRLCRGRVASRPCPLKYGRVVSWPCRGRVHCSRVASRPCPLKYGRVASQPCRVAAVSFEIRPCRVVAVSRPCPLWPCRVTAVVPLKKYGRVVAVSRRGRGSLEEIHGRVVSWRPCVASQPSFP
jgi:hypothetical protein